MRRRTRVLLTHGLLTLLATVAAVLTLGVGSALAADAVTNGSFETGDFSGWTTTDPGEPCTPWSVFASPSAEWCFTAFDSDWPEDLSATDGSYFADVTWDGDGTSDALLAQSVSVPADRSATLTWADNTSWDLTFGAKRPRFEYVDILSSDGSTVLHSYVIRVLAPRTEGATGWVTHALRLSGYGGESVQIRFRLTIPEAFTGPANFALDAVSIATA